MKLNHEEYLKQLLKTKKLELENLKVSHLVSIATFEAKKEMFMSQINSIEKQLER